MIYLHIAGVLLAGGKSRRYGSPKSFATHKGIPFYHYSIDALNSMCDELLIVTNQSLAQTFKEKEPNITIVTDQDEVKGQGPLAGILTAMEQIDANWFFILPTDVPFMEKWVVQQLIAAIDTESQVIIPTVAGRDQPLIGLYHSSVKQTISQLLQNEKRSMRALFENVHVKKITIDEEAPFRNINAQEDYFVD
ncbi:molybdenum cofactor guanylyltransferase [Aquibacillus salsiterrae]|uniref:Probable molybdenum cofactor guanylyltransferase n=1 Tax=Aquibacillus salsiterrae TaxID=2950439 RepID=A0A9X4AFB9_9BACI|nr:molybdenum cofactor guanylyltransferase [Aquibacillus salsiterrae]MDC3417847.1 molybdenum cofactor guanylyltransferase [Aquibacillus salsiterrae]